MTPTEQTNQWLTQVVIGMNLCPFAKIPFQKKQIRIQETHALKQIDLLTDLIDEIEFLIKNPRIETSILVLTQCLADFFDYNDFLDVVDQLLVENDWSGVFQVASFHPNYQFGGTQLEDAENLTNRAPFPLLHILRETSLDIAVDSYPNVDQIPTNNILKMQQLTPDEIKRYFYYLG